MQCAYWFGSLLGTTYYRTPEVVVEVQLGFTGIDPVHIMMCYELRKVPIGADIAAGI